jgi:hypothetical protein
MKKKIYICPKCGRGLNFSDNPEYTFQCFECDKDFYAFEAKEMEQPRMEGVVDYTDLAKASVEIKAITDSAIQESNRQIAIKGKDIVEQISEYINETIRPILDSRLNKDAVFKDHARIYTHHLRLDFGAYLTENGECQAQLFGHNYMLRVYFNANHEYYIENVNNGFLPSIVEEWPMLKDSMHRMISYGIEECNKANQKKLEKQKKMAEAIENFRL